ncbi:helix-turn-helix domain-containing protein [Burkholderia cepacia]|uniref:helix-turn-helix domain-containing protein n=1 Tax=Burkholderia cepacia TaxID=292 RepID=UPI001603C79C|nr:helix-turn-helix domain-containing protein [Burkholderia cepacia]MBB0187246.1 IS481 family transposase [Burkholderia cepacia]MBX3765090.1 helix-turn-helix domain-containing protein [Burkholderia cepacia]
MPWSTRDTMSLRQEFVLLARQEGCNRRELCRRFGISPQTGYKWLARYVESGDAGLADRTRRPSHSPMRTEAELEQAVIALRQQHPAWGGRKISRRLADLGWSDVPAPSTVTSILHRYGLIAPEASDASTPWQRFEHAEPNQLWQMDFKGGFALADGQRCSPLTVIDDHSRFNLVLAACTQTQSAVVQRHLRQAFERYGLPLRINADNGAPWGSPTRPGQLTGLGVWLIRLGVRLSYSRPAHPRPYPSTLAPIEYSPQDIVLNVGWNGELRFRSWRFKLSNALHGLPVALRPDPKHRDQFDLYFVHQHLGRIDLNLPDDC